MWIYEKPMIGYSLSTRTLVEAREITNSSTPQDLPSFRGLLENGSQWGISLAYPQQAGPDGLAQASMIGRDSVSNDHCH